MSPTRQFGFTKVDAAGNDFVIVEYTSLGGGDVAAVCNRLAPTVCHRQHGIGADGLICVDASSDAIGVHVANPDGSTASVCGNALRGVAHYLSEGRGLRTGTLRMTGVDHAFEAGPDGAGVSLRAQSAVGDPVMCEGLEFRAVHTGTEHVVTIVEELRDLDVVGVGRRVRYAPEFAPIGTNVNFVQVLGPDSIEVRTYERGVEQETLSCGSGAFASALVARALGTVAGETITVRNQSGTPLEVTFEGGDPAAQRARIRGKVRTVFTGDYLVR